MSFIVRSIAAALTPKRAGPQVKKETAEEVAADIARKQKARRDRNKAYWDFVEKEVARIKQKERQEKKECVNRDMLSELPHYLEKDNATL